MLQLFIHFHTLAKLRHVEFGSLALQILFTLRNSSYGILNVLFRDGVKNWIVPLLAVVFEEAEA